MFGKMLSLVLAASLIPLTAMAADVKEDAVEKALKKYEKTGKVERCIWIRRVYSSKVLDDYTILFKMRGNKAYINKLPHRCPRLKFEDSFSYRLHSSQLCSIDTITVIDFTGAIPGPTCGLGKFVEYKKLTKEQIAEKAKQGEGK